MPNFAFAAILVGASLMYIGGMYLNDYCDADFDQRHRPERPIPAGKIGRQTVVRAATVMILLGLLLIGIAGLGPFAYAMLLTALIVTYNVTHKKTRYAPLLMAGCRGCLYFITGAATTHGIGWPIVVAGALMVAYICGVGGLAKGESTAAPRRRIAVSLLLAGIPLVDIACIAGFGPFSFTSAMAFILCFLLALAAQRVIPAT